MATNFLTKIFGSRNDRLLKQYRKTVERINSLEPEFENSATTNCVARPRNSATGSPAAKRWTTCWRRLSLWCARAPSGS